MELSQDFPRMLYKADGSQPIHDGLFSTLIVNDADEHAAATADGWCNSTPEALQAKADAIEAARIAAEQAAEAEAQKALAAGEVTRADLEKAATDLGLKFDGRTSDKKLRAMVEAASAPEA